MKDAESHADEDKQRRDEVEQRNRLDGLVYQVEKESKEWGDKVPADIKERLDAAVESSKEALRGGDKDACNGVDPGDAAGFTGLAGRPRGAGFSRTGEAEVPAGRLWHAANLVQQLRFIRRGAAGSDPVSHSFTSSG